MQAWVHTSAQDCLDVITGATEQGSGGGGGGGGSGLVGGTDVVVGVGAVPPLLPFPLVPLLPVVDPELPDDSGTSVTAPPQAAVRAAAEVEARTVARSVASRMGSTRSNLHSMRSPLRVA